MGLTTAVELESSLEGDLLLDVLGLSGGGEVLLGLRALGEPKRGGVCDVPRQQAVDRAGRSLDGVAVRTLFRLVT